MDRVSKARLIKVLEEAKRRIPDAEEGFICWQLDKCEDNHAASVAKDLIARSLGRSSTFEVWAWRNGLENWPDYLSHKKSGKRIRIRWINNAIREIKKWENYP